MISWGTGSPYSTFCSPLGWVAATCLSPTGPLLLGRVYAPGHLLGHFSFIVFAGYLLVIFPLTFVVMSQRLLRFISATLATAGLTLLLVDSEVFSHFHLHLHPVV